MKLECSLTKEMLSALNSLNNKQLLTEKLKTYLLEIQEQFYMNNNKQNGGYSVISKMIRNLIGILVG